MIEILVVLLVLGAATVVFYPVLAGMGASRSGKPGALSAADPEVRARLHAAIERRNRLLRSINELDTEKAAGRISDQDYTELKRRDEIEAARAIEHVEAIEAELRAGRKRGAPKAKAPVAGRRVGPTLAWVGGTAAFAVILALTMARSVAPRPEGGTITGTIPGGGGEPAGGPASAMMPKADPARLAVLESALRRDSSNLKNLLEAGHLYLAEQKLEEAAQVTVKALSIDPQSAEANAHVAVLLMAEAGSHQDPDSAKYAVDAAVDAIDHAIRRDPSLPEGWLFKGMVMMAGRRDQEAAVEAWERYLKIAPPDADTTRIHAIVQSVRRAGSR